MLTTSETIQI